MLSHDGYIADISTQMKSSIISALICPYLNFSINVLVKLYLLKKQCIWTSDVIITYVSVRSMKT